MNATEFERELNKLTEDLAEKYIKLRDLELAGYKDEKQWICYSMDTLLVLKQDGFRKNFSQWQKTAKKLL